jgi:hypothetical protein
MQWAISIISGLVASGTVIAAISFLSRESFKSIINRNLETFKNSLNKDLESFKHDLGLDSTQHQIILQSQIQFKEKQLSEFYGPIYALLKRIRQIDNLWNEGKVKELDDAFIRVIRDSNNRIVDIILSKSHLISGNMIPESYTSFLTHVAVWHAFWDSPNSDWSAYACLPKAHYDMNFEEELFRTTEKLKQELDDLYKSVSKERLEA